MAIQGGYYFFKREPSFEKVYKYFQCIRDSRFLASFVKLKCLISMPKSTEKLLSA